MNPHDTRRHPPSLRRPLFTLLVLAVLAFGSLDFLGSANAQPAAQSAEKAAPPPAYVVIIHAKNPAQSVERDRLSKMFLKKVKRWDESEISVEAFDLLEDSEVREAFTRAIHRKNISAIKSYWQRMIFSGRDVPPDEIEVDDAMMARVADDQGAVGYVAGTTDLIDGVKAIEVVYEE